MDLATQTCIPCREGAPTLTQKELEALMPLLPGWTVVDQHHLQLSLRCSDFQSPLDWETSASTPRQ